MAKEFVSNLVIGGKLNPSLQNSFEKAGKIANKTASGIGKIGAIASKAVVAIGAIGAGSAGLFGLVKLSESAIEAGESVYKLSEKMNLTTKEASGLNRILQLTGTESKPFISAVQRMDKSILTAGAKGNTTTKIMDAFGLKLTDAKGKLLPMNNQLDVLAEGFDKAKKKGLENEYATAIFGSKAQNMIPLLQDYAEAKEVASKVKGIGIDPKAAHEASINLKVTKMQFKQFGLVAGNAVMPLVSKLLPKITDGFSRIADFISSHQGDIRNVIAKIGSLIEQIFAKIKPAISWIFNTGLPALSDKVKKISDFIINNWSKIEPLIFGIVAAIGAWKAITLGMQIYNGIMAAIRAGTIAAALAQWGLNAAVLANPMTWIVVGIAAAVGILVAGIILLIKNWDKVKAVIITVVKAIGSFFAGIWKWIKTTVITIFNSIVGFFKKWGLTILAVIMGPIGILGLLIYKNFDKIKAFLGNLAEGIIGIWQNNIIPFFNRVGAWFSGIWNGMVDGFKTAWSGVANFFKGVWDGIINIVKGYLNTYIKIANFLIGNLNKLQIDVPSWVPEFGGKHIGINIPLIPEFANGGFANRPSIFGEKGPEAAIPLKRTPRSYDLLNQTSRILGAGNNNSPIINITVNAPNGESKTIAAVTAEAIKQVIEQMQIDQGRLAF